MQGVSSDVKGGEGAAPAVEGRTDNFGSLPLVRSETRGTRTFVDIKNLGGSVEGGAKVLVRGRLDSSRGKGNLCFVILRQRVHTLQCVVSKNAEVSKQMVKFTQDVPIESIVDIEGILAKSEQPVDSCTVRDWELQVTSLFVVSASAVLPVQVSDCSVPPAVFAEQKRAQRAVQERIDALAKRLEEGEDVAADLTKLQEEKAGLATRVKVEIRLPHPFVFCENENILIIFSSSA